MDRVHIAVGAALLLAGGSENIHGVVAAKHDRVATRYVDIVDRPNFLFAYRPTTITVRAGTRVVWRNRSSQPHTVTATGKHPSFSSGTRQLINPERQWSFTFRRPGRYTYYCQLHPFMKGTVIVRR